MYMVLEAKHTGGEKKSVCPLNLPYTDALVFQPCLAIWQKHFRVEEEEAPTYLSSGEFFSLYFFQHSAGAFVENNLQISVAECSAFGNFQTSNSSSIFTRVR